MSEPAEDPFPRRLSDSELDDIFDTRVRPILTGPSRDTPTTVLLGGGQGSGKTTALSLVASQLGLPHAFLFEGDDFYDYHPSHTDLRRQAGGDVAQAMRQCFKDVEALRNRTLDYLLDNRMDLIRVGPMTAIDYVRESVTTTTSTRRAAGSRSPTWPFTPPSPDSPSSRGTTMRCSPAGRDTPSCRLHSSTTPA